MYFWCRRKTVTNWLLGKKRNIHLNTGFESELIPGEKNPLKWEGMCSWHQKVTFKYDEET